MRRGSKDFGKLLESIRKEQRLPALAAAVILAGEIRAAAAVGLRKVRTHRQVTVNDKFLIGSCGKTFTATLAAVCVEQGLLSWQTTIGDVFPDLDMQPPCERLSLQQLLAHR